MTTERKEITYRVPQEFQAEGVGGFSKYCDLIIGKRGLFSFCLYEFIQLFIMPVPGALGLALRRLFYPFLLKRCGRGVVFGRGVVLRHPHKIEIDDNVIIDDDCLLDAKGSDNEGIHLGSSVFIGRNSILSCKNGNIVLGPRVNMGFHSEIFSGSQVSLGEDTLVAAYAYIIGGGHDMEEIETAIARQGSPSYGIEIGNNCWIGAGAKIMDGKSLGDYAVIGSGAVVTQDIPERMIAAGVPAKIIRERNSGRPS